MSQKKPSLGRGLDALLGQIASNRAAPAVPAAAGTADASAIAATTTPAAPLVLDEQLMRLPLDLLQRGRYQPRVDMRPETLQELADSIKSQGVVQPIVVRPIEMPGAAPGASTRYEIIAGERRWRAAQLAGLHEIPAVVRHVADEAAVAMALIENIQREDLNPLEEARSLERLINEFKMTHQSAADAVGRSRAAVSNLLRLLELADEVKALVEERQIEMGHARALLGLDNRRKQAEVAALVANKGLSVRETEALVRRMAAPGPAPADDPPKPDANIRKLESDLTDRLGARVQIQHGAKGKGKLVIQYTSLDELDGILERIR